MAKKEEIENRKRNTSLKKMSKTTTYVAIFVAGIDVGLILAHIKLMV